MRVEFTGSIFLLCWLFTLQDPLDSSCKVFPHILSSGLFNVSFSMDPIYGIVAYWSSSFLRSVILSGRVWALYGHSRKILAILAFMFVAEFATFTTSYSIIVATYPSMSSSPSMMLKTVWHKHLYNQLKLYPLLDTLYARPMKHILLLGYSGPHFWALSFSSCAFRSSKGYPVLGGTKHSGTRGPSRILLSETALPTSRCESLYKIRQFFLTHSPESSQFIWSILLYGSHFR